MADCDELEVDANNYDEFGQYDDESLKQYFLCRISPHNQLG